MFDVSARKQMPRTTPSKDWGKQDVTLVLNGNGLVDFPWMHFDLGQAAQLHRALGALLVKETVDARA